MKELQKLKLPPVILASGTMGFFGVGYFYHKYIWPFVQFAKISSMFVAKTVTVDETIGNMPLKKDGSPRSNRPDCIFIDFKRWWKGGMLNAVGLSNFGLKYYLERFLWQRRKRQFAISLMLLRKTREDRVAEAREFVELFRKHLHMFSLKPILKLNISCPNTSHDVCNLVEEQQEILDILAELDLHIIFKVNVLTNVHSLKRIIEHEACCGICVSNTLPWNNLPTYIKIDVFPDFRESPLKKYGGGGYSGKHLLPFVVKWIESARSLGITKPIIGGGGVFTPMDVWSLYKAGASSISIGSPLMFRPWMVPLNILTAYILFKFKFI